MAFCMRAGILDGLSSMNIKSLDHFVLTVRNLEKTLWFYHDVLGMEIITFGPNRKALAYGDSKINLHEVDREFEPKANHSTPGSADLCFLTDTPLEIVVEELNKHQAPIEEGPVKRTGAQHPLMSVYIRDPDGNLVEISNEII